MSLLYFVVRLRCRRKESSRSLSHLLMSFLLREVASTYCRPIVYSNLNPQDKYHKVAKHHQLGQSGTQNIEKVTTEAWPIWTYQFYNTLASDLHDLTLSIIDLLSDRRSDAITIVCLFTEWHVMLRGLRTAAAAAGWGGCVCVYKTCQSLFHVISGCCNAFARLLQLVSLIIDHGRYWRICSIRSLCNAGNPCRTGARAMGKSCGRAADFCGNNFQTRWARSACGLCAFVHDQQRYSVWWLSARFWYNQDIVHGFRAQLHGTGSWSEVLYE